MKKQKVIIWVYKSSTINTQIGLIYENLRNIYKTYYNKLIKK